VSVEKQLKKVTLWELFKKTFVVPLQNTKWGFVLKKRGTNWMLGDLGGTYVPWKQREKIQTMGDSKGTSQERSL